MIGLVLAAEAREDLTGTYLNYLWISLGLIGGVCLLIWLGWRHRKRRQSGVSAPEEVPYSVLDRDPEHQAQGMVVGTVFAADYLDRLAVHQLGVRANGVLELHSAGQHPGLVFLRQGSRNFFIPITDTRYIRTDSGLIGKFVERDGVLLVGWQLGEDLVETGFRLRNSAEKAALREALELAISAANPHQHDPKDSSS